MLSRQPLFHDLLQHFRDNESLVEGPLADLKECMVVLSKPKSRNPAHGKSYIAPPGANPDFRPIESHSTAPSGFGGPDVDDSNGGGGRGSRGGGAGRGGRGSREQQPRKYAAPASHSNQYGIPAAGPGSAPAFGAGRGRPQLSSNSNSGGGGGGGVGRMP